MKKQKQRQHFFGGIVLMVTIMILSGCGVSQPTTLTALLGGKTPVVSKDESVKEPETDIQVQPEKEEEVKEDPIDHTNGGIVDDDAEDKSEIPAWGKLDKPDEFIPSKELGEDEKIIALTFDDGPDTRYTTAILDILKDKGVKATFFVVGQQVVKYPEVLKRMVDEGHAIGNHTYDHKDLRKLNKQEIIEQFKTTDDVIKQAIGQVPPLVRAPYGAVNDTVKELMLQNNRELIGWNIDTRDWAGTSALEMVNMVKHEARNNGNILMHSFGGKHIKHTVQALPDMIDVLQDMGYTLVTVDQLV